MAANQANAPAQQPLPTVPAETLFSYLAGIGKAAVKSAPRMAATLGMQIGIVVIIQFLFWWEAVVRYIPGFIRWPVVFLTATHNDLLAKTIYWVIIFSFGKRLLRRIQKDGFRQAMAPIAGLKKELTLTVRALEKKALPILLMGGGFGLMVANNFASYSRFSGARNKFDKYFIALVISFTISYLLGEGRKHPIFKISRLFVSDTTRLLKRQNHHTDNHTFVFLSGFVAGLLLDAPLILLQLKYGGYILGLVALAAAIVMTVSPKAAKQTP